MDSPYGIFSDGEGVIERFPIANKKMTDLVILLENKLPGVKWSISIDDNSYINLNGSVIKKNSINVGVTTTKRFGSKLNLKPIDEEDECEAGWCLSSLALTKSVEEMTAKELLECLAAAVLSMPLKAEDKFYIRVEMRCIEVESDIDYIDKAEENYRLLNVNGGPAKIKPKRSI
jgi:hypothetical protein